MIKIRSAGGFLDSDSAPDSAPGLDRSGASGCRVPIATGAQNGTMKFRRGFVHE